MYQVATAGMVKNHLRLPSPAILIQSLLKIWHQVPEANQPLVYCSLLIDSLQKNALTTNLQPKVLKDYTGIMYERSPHNRFDSDTTAALI